MIKTQKAMMHHDTPTPEALENISYIAVPGPIVHATVPSGRPRPPAPGSTNFSKRIMVTMLRTGLALLETEGADLTAGSIKTVNPSLKPQDPTPVFSARVAAPLLTSKETKLLKSVGTFGVKLAAQKLKLTVGSVYQKLHGIRGKIRKWHTFDREIEEIKKEYPRIRKYLRIEDVV
jgi:hypothetical protein